MKQQRHTKQRQRVLEAVLSRRDHPSADQIYLDVRQTDEHISRGTVYRNLNLLAEQGEVCQVKVPGADRYDLRAEIHPHLLCTACGTVRDAPLIYKAALDRQVAAETGYQAVRHQIVFEGLCPACQRRPGKAQTTS